MTGTMIDPTASDVHVRPARRDDRPRMLALWERSVRATHHFLEEEDVEMLRPLVAEELDSNAIDWWVLAMGDLVFVLIFCIFLAQTRNAAAPTP